MNDFTFIKDEKDFHKLRSTCIGASDIPVICGISKFNTAYNLWRVKTGRDGGFKGNRATYWGTKLEMLVLSSYIEKQSGKKIAFEFEKDYLKNSISRSRRYKPKTKYYPFLRFQHPELDFTIAHTDCVDMEKEINIEAKTGSRYGSMRRDGMDGFNPEDNSESGIPFSYYLQVQYQMLASGINETVLNALIDTSTELTYNIKANKKIQEKLIELSSRFMYLIKNDKEPMPSNKDDIMKIFPKTHNKIAYLFGTDSELAVKMIERKKFLKGKQKKIKSEIEDINDSLFVYVGGNKYLYSGDNQKLCSQVLYEKEGLVGLSEIKKDNRLYNYFKKNKLIKKYDVRYIS